MRCPNLLSLPTRVLTAIFESDVLDAVDRCCLALSHRHITQVAVSRPNLLTIWTTKYDHDTRFSEEQELLLRIGTPSGRKDYALCFHCLRYRSISEAFWLDWFNTRRIPQGIHATNAVVGWINSSAVEDVDAAQDPIGRAACPDCRISLPPGTSGLMVTELLREQLG